mmetsp:Transcript_23056/g.77856  ORF Transcript_23056/g.77856 Transcript_23056/m.77856 type:complete len:277 (-) Transcript_23056:1118-1948(-)
MHVGVVDDRVLLRVQRHSAPRRVAPRRIEHNLDVLDAVHVYAREHAAEEAVVDGVVVHRGAVRPAAALVESLERGQRVEDALLLVGRVVAPQAVHDRVDAELDLAGANVGGGEACLVVAGRAEEEVHVVEAAGLGALLRRVGLEAVDRDAHAAGQVEVAHLGDGPELVGGRALELVDLFGVVGLEGGVERGCHAFELADGRHGERRPSDVAGDAGGRHLASADVGLVEERLDGLVVDHIVFVLDFQCGSAAFKARHGRDPGAQRLEGDEVLRSEAV